MRQAPNNHDKEGLPDPYARVKQSIRTKEGMKNGADRRDFLKGSALLGGVAAIGGIVGCTPKDSDTPAADKTFPEGTFESDFEASVVELDPISKFSEEKTYDIVVIGAGTAGVPAVLTALEEGASVACLQKPSQVMANGNGSAGIVLEESNDVGKLQYMQSWRKASGYI